MNNPNQHFVFEHLSNARDYARETLQRPKESIFKHIAILMTHRLLITGVLILLQIAFFISTVLFWSRYFVWVNSACILVSVMVVLFILNKNEHPDYKIAWLIPILLFPIFGGLLYLCFGGNSPSARSLRRMNDLERLYTDTMTNGVAYPNSLPREHLDAAAQIRYIYNTSSCPPHQDTQTEYLPQGEVYFSRLLEELEKAEHYIFLQYFTINEGIMWNSILEILRKKAAQGLDIRVLYDDVGSIITLPKGFRRKLERDGIACAAFNPFIPVVSLRLNQRDHRKICIIDGHTAFTGGLNLSDEYINAWERFGHWKDTGILVRGDAVWNLTAIFLSCWDYTKGIQEPLDRYRPRVHHPRPFVGDGIVQPFSSNPASESTGAGVYLHLISRAKNYIYITTPYLIIDNTMTSALCDAARSGVDVRIITPHIPDKRYVFELTRAHYVPLLEAGVKIYEYTPGFIHAKTFAVDDEYGVVGTVNLDYRSLFLHYECAVWLYRTKSILSIRDDFLATQSLSQQVCLEQATRLGWVKRLVRSVLRVFAPLM